MRYVIGSLYWAWTKTQNVKYFKNKTCKNFNNNNKKISTRSRKFFFLLFFILLKDHKKSRKNSNIDTAEPGLSVRVSLKTSNFTRDANWPPNHKTYFSLALLCLWNIIIHVKVRPIWPYSSQPHQNKKWIIQFHTKGRAKLK